MKEVLITIAAACESWDFWFYGEMSVYRFGRRNRARYCVYFVGVRASENSGTGQGTGLDMNQAHQRQGQS